MAAHQAERRRLRELRRLVRRLNGCLAALTPQSRELVQLRIGLGKSRSHTASAVARLLHINAGTEAREERVAVSELRSSASVASCGANGAVTMIRVPAQNQLVSESPALAGSGSAQAGYAATPTGTPTGGTSGAPAGRVSAASAHRGSGSGNGLSSPPVAAIQRAAVGRLTTSSTPAAVLVLGALGALVLLGLLSLTGRRLARRERLQAQAPVAAPLAATFASAAAASKLRSGPEAPATSSSEWLPATESERATPQPDPELAAEPELQAEPEPARPAPAVPAAGPTPSAARAPSGPLPGSLPPQPVRSPNQEWLRQHRSQIAIALAAAAGGALRLLARGRRR